MPFKPIRDLGNKVHKINLVQWIKIGLDTSSSTELKHGPGL